ncbi:MAG: ABC transporter ATP-binding protein [Ruminococcaceae bacterium]|nr:ABC transporter ATP-binding protein [Oscillospiraceae bacterium]
MKRWFKYVKPYLPYFILGPLCMIIEVIGEVLMPKFLAIVINGAEDGTLTALGSIGTAGYMILTAVIMMIGGVGGAYFGAKASVNFAADLRDDVYRKVQKFSFANIDKFSTGSLVTRLTNDVTQLQNFVNMLLRMCLRSPGMLIGAIIMAVTMRPDLSIVLLVTIPLMLITILLIISKGFPLFAKMQVKIDAVNNTVQENITNVRVVKSFVREKHETEKFFSVNRNLKNAGMSAMKVMIFMGPVMTVFMNITTLIVLWFGANIVLEEAGTIGGMAIGDLSAFITYVTQILSSLMMVTMMLMTSSRALASAKRIKEVLDEDIDLDDTSAKYPDRQVNKGEIKFNNVSFRYYKNNEESVLSSINFEIEAGQTVGIIGSTGCGKTTLVSMIPRLYDVDSGEVLVDGVNVKDYSLYNLRQGIGVVLQKNLLFSGTIENNLRWGNEDATDQELKTAAEFAQAHGFITSFSDGYDTVLEQGGVNVSGGQKQRLCIARALLKKPKILILDDSTSAVDTATEKMIRKAFKEELAESTKIIIAQRISSVKDCDTIIVMDEGKITGIGSHDELIKNCTEYGEIYYSQMDKKEE